MKNKNLKKLKIFKKSVDKEKNILYNTNRSTTKGTKKYIEK